MDDPMQERSGLSPVHLPGLQRYRREKRHCDAASDHRRLKLNALLHSAR